MRSKIISVKVLKRNLTDNGYTYDVFQASGEEEFETYESDDHLAVSGFVIDPILKTPAYFGGEGYPKKHYTRSKKYAKGQWTEVETESEIVESEEKDLGTLSFRRPLTPS